MQVSQHQHKLIAAQPGYGVSVPSGIFQTTRDFNKHAIALIMTEAIIDLFESIKVQIAHGDNGRIALGARDGRRQLRAQQQSVG